MTARISVAITATFTADPILEVMRFWGDELSLDLDVAVAPYSQVLQQILDPASLLSRNRSGLGVVLARFEDWDTGGTADAIGATDLVAALRGAASRAAAPLLVCFCPASPAARASGRAAAFERGEALVASALAGNGVVEVVTSSELASTYPVADPHDPRSDAIGRIPYTPAQFAALGTLVARRLHALTSPPAKVIVADCDETLWGGVVGEDGPQGVIVDGPRRELQELLVTQHDAGVLLCLCSKNEDADVVAALETHPGMRLGLGLVAARRVGWAPKPEALRSLAEELGLGLESFVFLDDNPIERAAVRAGCPEVVIPEIPRDPARVPGFLRGLWSLDRRRITAEDGRRTGLHHEEKRRDEARRAADSLDAFLDGLELDVGFAPLTAASAARAAQLTQRTSQLNVTARRRTEVELLALTRSGELEGLVVEVRDRFGDYGTVGLVLFAIGPDALETDTLLLSCRALGRGVEQRMLARLGQLAEQRGRARVDVPFVPTARNRPALELLEAAGAAHREPAGSGWIFRLPAASLGAIPRAAPPQDDAGGAPPTAPQPTAPGPSTPVERARLLERIAGSLAEVEPILAAIHAHGTRPRARAPVEPPAGAVEETVAAIWREVLHVDEVGAREGFFAVGGDSVAMVRVISRVRDALGLDVTTPQFFGAPTIRGLAETIAGLREAAAPPDAAALLALVEGLSADEVRQLLDPGTIAGGATTPSDPDAARAITSIGLVTAERPSALLRALESYDGNARRHGRAVDLVVLDDSRAAETRQAYRDALGALGRARGAPIRYAGVEEKEAFARELAGRDLPPDVVRFALLPEGRGASTVGANRNALLLDATGGLVFSADDDTVCRIAPAPEREAGLASTAGGDPSDYWFFPDQAAAMRAASFVDGDLLSAHEALLGRRGEELLAGEREGPVLVTLSGLVGDCGWGAPFGWWLGPMGYLGMRGASLARLFASGGEACSSRAVLRVVRRPCLSDASLSMTTFVGLDARALLPPFCPIGRGEDNVFGAALVACIPGARFGHVPEALVHAPAPERRFWPGELARAAGGIDASRVLLELIRAFSASSASGAASPEGRVRALGRHLVEHGSMRREDFERVLGDRLAASNRALAAWLEDGLSERGAPAWWTDETRRFLVALRAAAPREDYVVPLDLLGGGSPDGARDRARDLVRRVGTLFVHWPDLVEAARGLRARGLRLGVPLGEGRGGRP